MIDKFGLNPLQRAIISHAYEASHYLIEEYDLG